MVTLNAIRVTLSKIAARSADNYLVIDEKRLSRTVSQRESMPADHAGNDSRTKNLFHNSSRFEHASSRVEANRSLMPCWAKLSSEHSFESNEIKDRGKKYGIRQR